MFFKKSIIFLILLIAVIFINAAILYFFAPKFIFQKIILINLFAIVLTYVLLAKCKIYNLFERSLVCVSIFFMLLVLNVFGPIFVDRSISYYIIIASTESNINLDVDSIRGGYDLFTAKRIEELSSMGLISVDGNRIVPTSTGRLFSSVALFIGELTETDNEYAVFKQKIQSQQEQ